MTYARIFDHTFEGDESILPALHNIAEGRADSCVWIVAQHPNDGDTVYEVIEVCREEIDGVLCWRYGRGGGGHALRTSYESQDIPAAAVTLAVLLGHRCGKRDAWLFRQPMPFEREPFMFRRKDAAVVDGSAL